VDRRFNRARYDAARTVEEFAQRLRDEVDLSSLVADLGSTVQETVGPKHASVWIPHTRSVSP
jgi:predicted unusual protein kinase regulating ubiquinone biosynthesis (AarF/ABC1/UbiB family)